MSKLFRYGLIVLLLITISLSLNSCSIKSLNPLFTEKDLIFEPELVGEWIDEEDEDQTTWVFQKASEKNYDLIFPAKQKTGANVEFEANLVKLDNFTFLDLYPKEPKKVSVRSGFYRDHFIATHTFCLVSLTPNQLQLSFLDITWLKEKVKEEKINASYLFIKDDLVLTGNTEELQKLVLEYAQIKEAFGFVIKLKRKVVESSTSQTTDKSQISREVFTETEQLPLNITQKSSLFNFQNSFWINLHHFLYQQALLKSQTSDKSASIIPSTVTTTTTATEVVINKLTPTQKRLWDKAISFYQNNYIKKDLLFSDEMTDIKQRLVKVNNESDLKKVSLPNPLVDILATVAPIYQNTWWIMHNRTNQAFISNINVMLSLFEPALTKQFQEAYKNNWQEQPIRVDVSIYAYKTGAYTTLNPGHIVIVSNQEGQEGFRPLEILFYQASYLLIEPLTNKVTQVAKEQNKVIAKDLLPTILAFTSGEIVKQTLAKNGLDGYSPYTYKESNQTGLEYNRVLEKYWRPFLLRKIEMDQAIKQLVGDLK